MWDGERSRPDFLLGRLEASQGRGELSGLSCILGPAQQRSGLWLMQPRHSDTRDRSPTQVTGLRDASETSQPAVP